MKYLITLDALEVLDAIDRKGSTIGCAEARSASIAKDALPFVQRIL